MKTGTHISATLIFLLIFTQHACKKNHLLQAAPDCIQEKVDEFKDNPHAMQIVRYKMKDGFAFLFDNPCANDCTSNFILDMDCDVICYIGLVLTNPAMCSKQNFDNFFSDPVVIWHK